MTTQHKAVQRVEELQAWALNAAVELRQLKEEVETNGTIIQYHEASIARLTSQRDALLEALRQIVGQHGQWNNGMWAANIARAAIKAVEGETK